MDELKPCPFCGGEAQRDSNNARNGDRMEDFKWFAIYCTNCLISSRHYDTPEEALKAWNRRAELNGSKQLALTVARLQAENAKLRELCADMWRDIPKIESCGWDTSTNTCTGSDECIGECSYWYRMRDLGIEVTP